MHACMGLDEFWDRVDQAGSIQIAGRSSVQEHIVTALNAGWTPEGLAAWVQRQITSASRNKQIKTVPGFVISQLKQIPAADGAEVTRREPRTGLATAAAANRDGCADCDAGWITTPDGREAKCRHCFPTPARQSA